MVRDDFMQQIITRDKEPITPFLERVRDLYEKTGISTILVAGSSGAYFHAADTILQMDCYQTLDITPTVKAACRTQKARLYPHRIIIFLSLTGKSLHKKASSTLTVLIV